MSYQFNRNLSTPNFTIEIDEDANYGYFEHNDLGDECGGGLWFANKDLEDYDGVPSLPTEVITALRNGGFTVDPIFD